MPPSRSRQRAPGGSGGERERRVPWRELQAPHRDDEPRPRRRRRPQTRRSRAARYGPTRRSVLPRRGPGRTGPGGEHPGAGVRAGRAAPPLAGYRLSLRAPGAAGR